MCDGHEVLMEVNDNILLIVGNRQGILDQQISPHPIGLLDSIFIIIIIMIVYYSKILKTNDHTSSKGHIFSLNKLTIDHFHREL